MTLHYLEIVANDVDAVCSTYETVDNLVFSEPVPELGNARTAKAEQGFTVGVRAPMHDAEEPACRPYWLVDNIESAIAQAVDAGGEVAVPPMQIPGRGTIALFILADTQHGLWQL